jgi:hypothetical protein
MPSCSEIAYWGDFSTISGPVLPAGFRQGHVKAYVLSSQLLVLMHHSLARPIVDVPHCILHTPGTKTNNSRQRLNTLIDT